MGATSVAPHPPALGAARIRSAARRRVGDGQGTGAGAIAGAALPGGRGAGRHRSRAARGEGDRLREEILTATEKLLVDTGDENAVSIRAIADAVGVTPPSIYLHFADKRELIKAVSVIHFGRFHSRLEAAVSGVDDPLEALRRRGRAYVAYGAENPEHYRILFMGRDRGEVTREDFEAGRAPGADAFMALVVNVGACMESGAFARRDPFRVATGLWALVHGITSLRVSAPNFPGIADDSFLDQVLEMAARGLAPAD